jgi:hypothetical protein
MNKNNYPGFEKQRREFQKRIRNKNSGIPPIFGLLFFLMLLAVIGRMFGWW